MNLNTVGLGIRLDIVDKRRQLGRYPNSTLAFKGMAGSS